MSPSLPTAGLSRITVENGRQIPELALRRIEKGTRRVDADDLMVLAVALKTSPVALLMPAGGRYDEVEVTGRVVKVTCDDLWQWLTAFRPTRSWTPLKDRLAWLARSRPDWTLELTGGTPDVRVTSGDD